MLKNNMVKFIIFIISLIGGVFYFHHFSSKPSPDDKFQVLSYSKMIDLAKIGQIKAVGLLGNVGTALDYEGRKYRVIVPDDARPTETLVPLGVEVGAFERQQTGFWLSVLSWLTSLAMVVIFAVAALGPSGRFNPFSFGKSRLRRHQSNGKNVEKTTFNDVAGVDQARLELAEIVDFLKSPDKFTQLGARIPRGVLLIGPPGTGKTLLAKAVAGEASVPFFSVTGSDFVEMFVGVGARRVRDTFATARKHAPCIVFIDEIDGMGRHRSSGGVSGNDEREQTLNQMLAEMDGFSATTGIIIVAATNRPDVLDNALLRRFDRQVVVPNPDITGRAAILKVHLNKIVCGEDINESFVLNLARGTPSFSGANLAKLVNEAAINAGRRLSSKVEIVDFEIAKDRIMLGAERSTLIMSEHERSVTAYHEAGHALCALMEEKSDPIHKVTIVPHGLALGLVVRMPERDRMSLSYATIDADLTVAMGGRAAEGIIFGHGEITTGAQSDIYSATVLARKMVTLWGFSPKLGSVNYDPDAFGEDGPYFSHSNETLHLIDEEVRSIVSAAAGRAERIISDNKSILEEIARSLMDKETLTGDEVRAIFERSKKEMESTKG